MQWKKEIEGYAYGKVQQAPYGEKDLALLKASLLWSDEDDENLQKIGELLKPHLDELLDLWYGFVGSHSHLVYYFTSDGKPNEAYLAKVRDRFGQWVLDLCFRPKDQTWLNYQWEIGKRHYLDKNKTDNIPNSPPFIPMRYMIAFIYPISATVKSFLAQKGVEEKTLEKLWQSWFKAVVLSVALWCEPYAEQDAW